MDLDEAVLDFIGCISICISFDITKITNVSHLISGATMGKPIRVVMSASCNTALGEISELMDVESVLSWGKTLESCLDLNLLTCSLNELDDTAHS